MKRSICFKKDGKEIEFGGLEIDDDLNMRFKTCSNNEFGIGPFTFIENKSMIISDNHFVRLTTEILNELKLIKAKFVEKINALYKDIVSGEEELMFIDLGLEDYPYLVTTKTILDEGDISPKYNKALEFSFSDRCFSNYQLGDSPKFKDFSDLQNRLSHTVKDMNLQEYKYEGEKVVYTTLKDLLGRIA